MIQIDLFSGEVPAASPEPKPVTETEEYKRYMASASWKRKRFQKLAQVGERCESCGLSKWSVTLEVHHATYKNLGHEPLDELQVLCRRCHEGLHDALRTGKTAREIALFALWARMPIGNGDEPYSHYGDFAYSMDITHGVSWDYRMDNGRIKELFDQFIAQVRQRRAAGLVGGDAYDDR